MASAAILITVHNHRQRTLDCLEECFRQIDSFSGREDFSFKVFLNDDGSTDALQEAVSRNFPEVRLVPSGGESYWCAGLRTAWTEAAKEDFDFYIWLDWSISLREGALSELIDNSYFLGHKAVIVGTVDDGEGNYLFGGRTRKGKPVLPNPKIPVPCKTFDGKFVLVPKYAYDLLGLPDDGYFQNLGDYDYGIRATRAGITTVVAPGVQAYGDKEASMPVWNDGSYSLKERYAALQSPTGKPLARQFVYDYRSNGLLTAVNNFVRINFQVIFPKKKK